MTQTNKQAATKPTIWPFLISYNFDILDLIICLAAWVAKMNETLHCVWLLEWARWCYLAHLGLLSVSPQKTFSESQMLNPLLTKPSKIYSWKLTALSFYVLMDINSVLVHKQGKKELEGQYPAILTSCVANNAYILKMPVGLKNSERYKRWNVYHVVHVR